MLKGNNIGVRGGTSGKERKTVHSTCPKVLSNRPHNRGKVGAVWCQLELRRHFGPKHAFLQHSLSFSSTLFLAHHSHHLRHHHACIERLHNSRQQASQSSSDPVVVRGFEPKLLKRLHDRQCLGPEAQVQQCRQEGHFAVEHLDITDQTRKMNEPNS